MIEEFVEKMFGKKAKEKTIRMSELKDGQCGRVVGGDTNSGTIGHHVIRRGSGYVELERPDRYWGAPETVKVVPVFDVKQTQLAMFEEIHEGD